MGHDGKADFRSDTVTRPSPSMYEAMAKAPLGDDVFRDDPTVIALQEKAASMFEKEAGLFVPSGTMGNQIAVRVHTQPGDELIIEQGCHTFVYEQGGVAQISGVQARPLPGSRGQMSISDIAAAVRLDDDHFPRTSLVILENTHNSSGGSVLPMDYVSAVREIADSNNMALHMDGARIFNAAAASGLTPGELAAGSDSVTFCLSKALSAPVGSILMGSEEFIREARRVRKVLGGGLRQVGILAAAGIVALDEMPQKLCDDHERASLLQRGLARIDGLSSEPPETNMVYVHLADSDGATAAGRLADVGILVAAVGPQTLRFVTHKDVDDADVERAVAAMADITSHG